MRRCVGCAKWRRIWYIGLCEACYTAYVKSGESARQTSTNGNATTYLRRRQPEE